MEEAKVLIRDARLKVISVDDFAEAAETVVKLASMVNLANSLNLDINFKSKQKSDYETSNCKQ